MIGHHFCKNGTYRYDCTLSCVTLLPSSLTSRKRIRIMSRVGECYDNAAMESFFSSFKGECMERHTFHTRQEARSAIFEYLECFYNRVRRHSTLKYLSPVAYEQQMR